MFCSLLEISPEDIKQINNHSEWAGLKTRLLSLIDLLGSLGCYILKKGTIEAYYLNANQLTTDEKPNAAAHEVSYMGEMELQQLNDAFNDVVDAIKYAAQAKSIDEGAAIRDIVLAIVTPALASITEATTDIELNTKCRNLFGNIANLFKLSVETTDQLYLVVSLETSILDVKGFPLRLAIGANPIVDVSAQMELE